jgi:endonuclease/exonuclease/phosphatase family metal-dependent hydrolase
MEIGGNSMKMKDMKLKMASVNIEAGKHLMTVREFLTKEKADLVCLMEVRQADVLDLAGATYPFVVFAPSDILVSGEVTGVAILSKYPIFETDKYYCGENSDKYTRLPRVMGTHAPTLLMAKIMKGNVEYQLGAIHFSWTADGHENERQIAHLAKLLKYLNDKGELVLSGDFNIPRGYPLYYLTKENYKDNIPQSVSTTIDSKLHRANWEEEGKLKLVVDYVFSTPKYEVSGVRVESGVSDHCGVVCKISKLI